MQNSLKRVILQSTTENSNVNIAMLQALQCTTVVAAVDRPEAMQNGQNNEITTIHNILPICSAVNAIKNSNYLYYSSNDGVFGTAGLVLLHCTSSATKNSRKDQQQPLLMV